jgi:hypothetical protein
MYEFAQTELDSAWQSVHALQYVTDPRIRSLLLQHALEELHHSELFADAASEQSDFPQAVPLTRRSPLSEVESGDGSAAAKFLAALAVGENEIRNDFQVYRRAIPDPRIRRLFAQIENDEEGHAENSMASLTRLARENGISMRAIRWRHAWELLKRRHKSLGMKMGALILDTALTVLYFVFGGFGHWQARRRMVMSYEQQLKISRQQYELAESKVRPS